MGKTLVDIIDSYIHWLVLFFFLTSINLAMEASAYLVNDNTGEMLRTLAHWPTRAGGIAIIVAVFFWLRVPREKRKYREQRALLGEFVIYAVKHAAIVAFLITLCLVGILDVVTNHTLLPADFFIKLPGISLTGGFSISFYLFNRDSGHSNKKEGLNEQ